MALDLGQKGEFKSLAGGVNGNGVGMPGLAVEGGVEVVAADEEDAVEFLNEGGDQVGAGLVGDGKGQAAGFFDGGGVVAVELVTAGLIGGVHGDADQGSRHGD